MAPRKKPANVTASIDDGGSASATVSIGDRFTARSPRGTRTIQIEAVDLAYPPRVEAREIYPTVPCTHLTATLFGGACALCPAPRAPDKDTFSIVLTCNRAVWRMPSAYTPITPASDASPGPAAG